MLCQLSSVLKFVLRNNNKSNKMIISRIINRIKCCLRKYTAPFIQSLEFKMHQILLKKIETFISQSVYAKNFAGIIQINSRQIFPRNSTA